MLECVGIHRFRDHLPDYLAQVAHGDEVLVWTSRWCLRAGPPNGDDRRVLASVSIGAFRPHAGRWLRQARQAPVLLTWYGRPVAVLRSAPSRVRLIGFDERGADHDHRPPPDRDRRPRAARPAARRGGPRPRTASRTLCSPTASRWRSCFSKGEADRWERIERGLATLHGLEIYPELARGTSELGRLVRRQRIPSRRELERLARQPRDILGPLQVRGVSDVRLHMAEVLDEVSHGRSWLIVSSGRYTAVMIRPAEYDRLLRLRRTVLWFRAAGLDLATADRRRGHRLGHRLHAAAVGRRGWRALRVGDRLIASRDPRHGRSIPLPLRDSSSSLRRWSVAWRCSSGRFRAWSAPSSSADTTRPSSTEQIRFEIVAPGRPARDEDAAVELLRAIAPQQRLGDDRRRQGLADFELRAVWRMASWSGSSRAAARWRSARRAPSPRCTPAPRSNAWRQRQHRR